MIVPDGRFSERSIGFDAGHSEEPSGLSAKPRPSSRCGLSAGPDRGAVFAVDGNGVGLGNSPLGRQVSERTGHASRHGSRVQCGRHIAHRSLSLLVHGNRLVVASGCRFCGAHAHPTEGRFSPRHAIRSLRSCGRVAQAAASRMDVARRIRHNSGNPFDARVSLSCCSPGLSSTNNRGCHDAAGQRTVQRARHFRSVSSSLGCRNLPSRTTSQARSCITLPLEVKVSADALLQLACWCDGRAAASNAFTDKHEQGGSSWPHKSPPARIDNDTATGDGRAAGTALDADSQGPSTGTARATDTDPGPANGSSQQQGGSQ